MNRSWLQLTFSLMLAMPVLPAQAVPNDDGNESNDPGRAVARVSLLNGDVSVRRGDSGDWVAAAINAPLMADDRVATAPEARAEVQLDYYHRIRLAGDSEVRLAQLDERNYQIQVSRGTVTFSAIRGGDAQVELSMPGASLRPLAYGAYRITVSQDGSAELTVRSGEADIYSSQGSQRLRTGRTMRVRLTGSGASEYMYVAAIPHDAWDEFNQRRDSELGRAQHVYQYVPRDVYGAEDLYGNGDWTYVAPYGWCWRPYVADGWAPYRYGRWSWFDYYGWTWISYDPWGWAPYHYGRWFSAGGRWCWYPGAMGGHHHYWSPALVGWFGWNNWGGFSAGVGFGWGAVGWVPLAPYEPMHRWWGGSFYRGYRGGDYFGHTTIVNNINITNVYRNARVDRGYTVVNGHDFGRGDIATPLRVSGNDLGRASTAHGMLPVSPTNESLRFNDRNAASSLAGRASTSSDRFYSRSQTSRVDRIPFEDQRRGMERATSSMAQGAGYGSSGGGRSTPAGETRSSQSGGANAGWSHFGDPQMGARGGSNEAGNAFRGSESNRGSAWTGFGDPMRGGRSTDSGASGRSQGGWSTGGQSGTSGGAWGSPAAGSSRQDSSRGSWSTGGGSGVAPSRQNEGAARSRGGDAGSEGSARGGWSTGGGSAESGQRWSTGRSESPESGVSNSRSGSRGGASDRSTGGYSSGWGAPGYSSPRSSGGDSGGSSGPGYASPRSSGGYSAGRDSAPRSSGGGGYAAPRSSGSFGGGSMGGGGGMSRGGSGGGSTSGGSMGGGAGRSSGGGGGGGSRGGSGRGH